jgi:ABC-type transporter Mla subunit MlaD
MIIGLLKNLNRRLDAIEDSLDQIKILLGKEVKEMSAIDDKIAALQDKVAEQTTVDQSAMTLLQGLSEQLQAALQAAQNAGATPDQLAAFDNIVTAIGTNDTALAAAVAANTQPPAPPPAPSP